MEQCTQRAQDRMSLNGHKNIHRQEKKAVDQDIGQ